jgi:hypothetical protein
MKTRCRVWGAAALVALAVGATPVAHGEELSDKIDRLEGELQEMKRELQRQKDAQAQQAKEAEELRAKHVPSEPATVGAVADEGGVPMYRKVLDRVQIGGYGSTRFEASDLENQNNSFVLRRFVLTADANIAPRLRSYFELEFERFRKLEVQKQLQPASGGLLAEQEIEATNNSEIALEQAWVQYDVTDWLKFRGGGVLVPLGRFNLNHDDNRWDLPRRSLVDRGVPVLPTTAAWDEVGMGFVGDVTLSDQAVMNYQVYAMNGVVLDYNLEQVAQTNGSGQGKVVYDVVLEPSNGGFAQDVKDSKAVAGRIALSPALGHEIAGSWYYGRYTPDFLANEDLWAIGIDGRTGYGPFELEGEGILTRFEGTRHVARSLAATAYDDAAASSDPSLETEVEYELADLAHNRYGYWLEARYRFWPEILNRTFLGKPFENPQLIAVFRPEQAWLDGLVDEAAFSGGQLTTFETSNRRVDRFTVGLAYRPVPLVVFQLAYEYTQTNSGQSLASVTNYLPAGPTEDHVNTVMVGTAFGF